MARNRNIAIEVEFLGNVTDGGVLGPMNGTLKRNSADNARKDRLPGSVWTDDSKRCATRHTEADVVQGREFGTGRSDGPRRECSSNPHFSVDYIAFGVLPAARTGGDVTVPDRSGRAAWASPRAASLRAICLKHCRRQRLCSSTRNDALNQILRSAFNANPSDWRFSKKSRHGSTCARCVSKSPRLKRDGSERWIDVLPTKRHGNRSLRAANDGMGAATVAPNAFRKGSRYTRPPRACRRCSTVTRQDAPPPAACQIPRKRDPSAKSGPA